MGESEKYEVLDGILSKNIGWVNTADTKAGFVFLISTAMLGILAAFLPAWDAFTISSAIWTIISATLLAGSILFLALVNFPELEGPPNSLIFFGTAAKMKRDEFTAKALQGLTSELLMDMAGQCHRTAEIAQYKFRKLQLAFLFLFLAFVPWIITLIVLFPNGPAKIL